MSTFSPHVTTGQLGRSCPATQPVLCQYGLDSPEQTLAEAVQAARLDLGTVLTDLQAVGPRRAAWGCLGLGALCDALATHHILFFHPELTHWTRQAAEVAQAPGFPAGLPDLCLALEALAHNLHTYLLKEDVMLFPAIRHLEAGRGAGAAFAAHVQGPLERLSGHQADLQAAFGQLRRACGDWAPPPGAPAPLRELLAGLGALQAATETSFQDERRLLFGPVLARFEGVTP
ncbi:hypothetical protein [Deinococcus multiflagellatus]|uniref:Hemerythrin-like domain-containing protein n=1 Tax=Deinococcus multiflagellatus TaxID=1656887 RepID=A0ABW1ZV42_9DEIO|nr:hypothetical protein [Deinococcus multiflagellatus]MBZ9713590.1 hypothetical protein [Deinococcus multiflagellatus]